MTMNINYIAAKLKNVELKQDEYGTYFLDLTYEYENSKGFYEINIPWVHLPICKHNLPASSCELSSLCRNPKRTIDLGFGDLDVCKDRSNDMYFEITEIKKKPRKMTLEEIEKALGYKVELVE